MYAASGKYKAWKKEPRTTFQFSNTSKTLGIIWSNATSNTCFLLERPEAIPIFIFRILYTWGENIPEIFCPGKGREIGQHFKIYFSSLWNQKVLDSRFNRDSRLNLCKSRGYVGNYDTKERSQWSLKAWALVPVWLLKNWDFGSHWWFLGLCFLLPRNN